MAQSHRKLSCQFCDTDVVCLRCNNQIDCRNLTDCELCGDIYGRPTINLDTGDFRVLSASVIIIHDLPGRRSITLIQSPDGKLSDAGGKFDPSHDTNLRDTASRELREEAGIYSIITSRDKYFNFKGSGNNGHGCFLLRQTENQRSISPMKVPGESQFIEIPLIAFLMIPAKFLSMRLNRLLKAKVSKKLTLHEFLQLLSVRRD